MKEPARPRCPGCGSASFAADPAEGLVCVYCHSTLTLAKHACPNCGAPYVPTTHYCPTCDSDLLRECPACSAPNPPSARECVRCGQRLEMLDSLFSRVTGLGARWLREVREESPALKAQQQSASQARLAQMWADEMRRREAMARDEAERDRQESILITATIVIGAIFLIIVVIAMAIAAAGG